MSDCPVSLEGKDKVSSRLSRRLPHSHGKTFSAVEQVWALWSWPDVELSSGSASNRFS